MIITGKIVGIKVSDSGIEWTYKTEEGDTSTFVSNVMNESLLESLSYSKQVQFEILSLKNVTKLICVFDEYEVSDQCL